MSTFTEKYSPILENIQRGSKSMDGIIEMLRLRVNAETQFTNSLQKIIESSSNLIANGCDTKTSLRTQGFDALFCDMKNEYHQRMEFLNSLKDAVLDPCLRMKHIYEQKHKSLVHETKQKSKLLEKHQTEYLKLKTKYDKVMAKCDDLRAKKKQPNIERRYSQKQIVWKQQKRSFDDQISYSLVNIQLIEFQRMNTLKDALTNWTAFITNFCANRNYDIKNLAQSMSQISIENDLHIFAEQKPRKIARKNTKKKRTKSYASSIYTEFRKQSATFSNP